MAAVTVGLGGALRGIFTAGDEDNEDRKLRSIQGLSGSVLSLNWFPMIIPMNTQVNNQSVLLIGGMVSCDV